MSQVFGAFLVLALCAVTYSHHRGGDRSHESSEEDYKHSPQSASRAHHRRTYMPYPRYNELDLDRPEIYRPYGFPPEEQLKQEADSSAVGGPNGSNQVQRMCEKKYTEYIKSIFPGEEDTAQDASDSEFDGRVLAYPGEYPHMAALGFETEGEDVDFKCGGSLISERFVITAAHCANFTGQAPTKVRIGDLNLKDEEQNLEPQVRNVKRIQTHPQYMSTSYYNDIALLELDEDVSFTEFVRPIRLWVDSRIPYPIAYAMGYGSTAFGKARTNRLTNLNMTIVPNEDCNELMPIMTEAAQGIIVSQICAQDYRMNRDTCQGDSGGPLQLNLPGRRRHNRQHYHLIGITSYGMYCRSGYPSVYTRVSSYLDWIERIVWRADF